MFRDLVAMAWRALWERKGRTVGAMVGVAIAFAALAYALLVGQTFKSYTESFFTSNFGTNLVYVRWSPEAPGAAAVGQQGFTDADIASIASIEGVKQAIPIATQGVSVRSAASPQARTFYTLYGIDPNALSVLLPSTALQEGSLVVGSNVVLVGYNVAFDPRTGARQLSPGDALSLAIAGRPVVMSVAGILAPGGFGAVDPNNGIVMDLSYFRQVTGRVTYSTIVAVVDDPRDVDAVVSAIQAAMPYATVISPQAILQTINQYLTSFQLFMGTLAGVATVITALWLYDTMSISVIQRTKEIGILRAVGFKRRQVTLLFLTETLIIAAVGVLAGLAATLALAHLAGLPLPSIRTSGVGGPAGGPGPAGRAFSQAFSPQGLVLDPLLLTAVAALVVAVNVVGALAPAVRAGRIRLVDALKYE